MRRMRREREWKVEEGVNVNMCLPFPVSMLAPPDKLNPTEKRKTHEALRSRCCSTPPSS